MPIAGSDNKRAKHWTALHVAQRTATLTRKVQHYTARLAEIGEPQDRHQSRTVSMARRSLKRAQDELALLANLRLKREVAAYRGAWLNATYGVEASELTRSQKLAAAGHARRRSGKTAGGLMLEEGKTCGVTAAPAPTLLDALKAARQAIHDGSFPLGWSIDRVDEVIAAAGVGGTDGA
jgi:hypothetical protein